MIKSLILISFSFVSLISFGQVIDVKVEKSEVFKDEYRETEILASQDDVNGGVLILRSYNGNTISPTNGYYFEHYDSNLKLVKDFQLETKLPVYQKNNTALGYFFIDNEIHIADILFDLKEKAIVCSITTVSFNDFKSSKKELFKIPRDEMKKLGLFALSPEFRLNAFSPYENRHKSSAIKMSVNKDKSAFAIAIDFFSEKAETIKLFVFDSKMNLNFNKVFTKDINDDNFELHNLEISNDGDIVYLTSKVYTDESKAKEEGGKYVFEITSLTKNTEKFKVVDVENHFIQTLKTVVLHDKIVLVGFYSDKNDNRFKGVSYFQFKSENLELLYKKFNPFSNQFIIDKYGVKRPKELKNILVKEVLVLKNDEVILNAEEIYKEDMYYDKFDHGKFNNNGKFNNTSRDSKIVYNFNDIISVKLNEDGNLLWSRNINKLQNAVLDKIPYISYSSLLINDTNYFFLNASEKIKNLDNNRIEFVDKNIKKSDLYVVRVTEDGTFNYQIILKEDDNEVPFMVANGIKMSNTIIFPGRKGSKKQLLKISF
ncbi:hypothetical protein [Flavobacterium tegetincola]|uniref:hypothetical protein n=1 Tax=Flavobacterium tegetincola TaxID=150172 RepID=UPI0004188272|nr:hypothetical protein [Flavobacterium tegetincola]